MNYYDIPGGKVEENESAIDASIREFKEETGIEVINQKYKGNGKEFKRYTYREEPVDIICR